MLWVMACGKWRFWVALTVALTSGCDDGDSSAASEPSSSTSGEGDDGGSTSGATSSTPSSASTTATTGDDTTPTTATTTDPSTSGPDPTAAAESSGDEPIPGDGWLEIGYGLDEFFPFEDELPITLGPQGFMMFSLPLRGSDFPVPPDPFDFDHPDTPVLSVWTDIEGVEPTHPSGHFAAYLDYPVPFAISDDEDVDYEFVSVWLVIPESTPPSELAGRQAVVHAELQCSDGQLLVDEHILTVVDQTDAGTGGKGKG